MIDWLLLNHRGVIRASRLILAGCALALLGIAGLPHTPLDWVIGIIGIAVAAAVFLAWLGLALIMVIRPSLLPEISRKRAEVQAVRRQELVD